MADVAQYVPGRRKARRRSNWPGHGSGANGDSAGCEERLRLPVPKVLLPSRGQSQAPVEALVAAGYLTAQEAAQRIEVTHALPTTAPRPA